MILTRNDSTLLADTHYFVVILHGMSHYPGVTVWSAFLLFNVFVCLSVCWYLSCLSVCFAVCMSYLSICEHYLVLYLRFVYGPMAKIQ